MSVKIVTDSTCDLPQRLIDEFDITVLPLYIHIGRRSYLDGIDISRQDFYQGLPTFKEHPTTAAPSSAMFDGVYQEAASKGADEILSIHISESLSAVPDVARIAAKSFSTVPVRVFDSQQLSLGAG